MFYTIYKITNLINGKIYVGKHQTKNLNDDYFGSGKLLRRAFKKHGQENFSKEILEIFDTEKKMDFAEKILVVTDSEVTYNLCEGGHGGFGYINDNPELVSKRDKKEYKQLGRIAANKKGAGEKALAKVKELRHDPQWCEEIGKRISDGLSGNKNTLGLRHSSESKKKMSECRKGKNNINYDRCWITNDVEELMISKNDIDLWTKKGYRRGRINKEIRENCQ